MREVHILYSVRKGYYIKSKPKLKSGEKIIIRVADEDPIEVINLPYDSKVEKNPCMECPIHKYTGNTRICMCELNTMLRRVGSLMEEL